jgi:hypothetical protein
MKRLKPALIQCPSLLKSGRVCGVTTPAVAGPDGRVASRFSHCFWHAQLLALEQGSVELAPGFTLVYEAQQDD